MNHAFLTGSKLDECTEFLNADNDTLEDLSFLIVGNNGLDVLDRLVHHFLIGTTYGYLTVISNINLYAGTGNDLVDGLATLTNHITDLLRINVDGNDLRSVRSNLFTRLCNRLLHTVIHDEKSCFSTSCNGTFYDRSGQTMNLNIHLDCGNTIRCTGDLKVHIAEEVFQSLNIS